MRIYFSRQNPRSSLSRLFAPSKLLSISCTSGQMDSKNSITRRILYLTQTNVACPAIDDKTNRNRVLYNRNEFLFDVPCAAVMFCERNVKSRHSCLHTVEAMNFDESMNGSESIWPKSILFDYAHMKMEWCIYGFINRHLSSMKTMKYCKWNRPQNSNRKNTN